MKDMHPFFIALKSAIGAGLLTLGLCFPLFLWRVEPDVNNHLTLIFHPEGALFLMGLVVCLRLVPFFLSHILSRIFAISALCLLTAQFYFVGFTLEKSTFLVFVGGGLLICAIGGEVCLSLRSLNSRGIPAKMHVVLKHYLAYMGLGALFLFPLVMLALLGPHGSLKWINNYGIQILIYVMLGWGLNIVVGLAGLLDLGYVAFYAVGAYTYALLSTSFGLSFWICLPLAGLLAACWGILLGFPVLRLQGDYLAIVTLAFGEIIRIVLINWVDVTNGYAGISSIPSITFFGWPFKPMEGGFAHMFGLEFSPIHRSIFLFYVILSLALLTCYVTLHLRKLPIGQAWEALREDEIACRALGIHTVTTKLTAFALGAMFAGFAGSFFAVRQNFVSPESFTFLESATILAIVVLGGMGSQLGIALAAIVMIGGTEILRELDVLKQIFGADFDPSQYRMLLFGMAMIGMMIWKPRGLISHRLPTVFWKEQKGISSSLVQEGHG